MKKDFKVNSKLVTANGWLGRKNKYHGWPEDLLRDMLRKCGNSSFRQRGGNRVSVETVKHAAAARSGPRNHRMTGWQHEDPEHGPQNRQK
jgi:hypothetical protein